MKTCTKCGHTQSEDSFHFSNRALGTRQKWCKICMGVYTAAKYADNRKFLKDYLRVHPCVDCGEPDIIVLEFDHRELRGPQDKPVTRLTTSSRATIEREIAKCDVRCANCHTRRTRVQMGWA